MTQARCCVAVLLLIGLLQAQDSSRADGAAVAALQRVSKLPHAVVIRRIPAEAQWDLVVAMAGQQPAASPGNWSTRERLGVLLQDRTDPAKVDVLAAQPGPNDDCYARIVRMTAAELVVSCTGEKDAYGNQNFVYDIRSRKLVSHFSYSPFWTARVLPGKNGPQFVMADYHRLLLVDIDPAGAPRVTPAAEARPVLAQIPLEENTIGDQTLHVPAQPPDAFAAFGPGRRFHFAMEKNKYGSEYPVLSEGQGAARKTYALPQTDLATWQRARPDDAKAYLHPDQAEMNEQIGPHQVEDGRLWFGKTFYNGEGATGLGGFGYFDTATASYHLIAPPEIYPWSVSAILVDSECVWLALYHRGEYGDSPGGLLRWDRKAATVRQFAVKTVATGMVEAGGTLYLGATNGIVTVRGEQVASYFVVASADGKYQVVER
jgi:hypothetical protein